MLAPTVYRQFVANAFDPDQPRDERGRWVSSGSSGGTVVVRSDPLSGTTDPVGSSTGPAHGRGSSLARPLVMMGDVPVREHEFSDYLEKHGQEWTPAPLPPGIRRMRMGECFKNATLTMLDHPDLSYCEGIAYTKFLGPDLGFLHGWCVDKDGKVVDPTWGDSQDCRYFGVKYDRAKYQAHIVKTGIYGIFGGDTRTAQEVLKWGGL